MSIFIMYKCIEISIWKLDFFPIKLVIIKNKLINLNLGLLKKTCVCSCSGDEQRKKMADSKIDREREIDDYEKRYLKNK